MCGFPLRTPRRKKEDGHTVWMHKMEEQRAASPPSPRGDVSMRQEGVQHATPYAPASAYLHTTPIQTRTLSLKHSNRRAKVSSILRANCMHLPLEHAVTHTASFSHCLVCHHRFEPQIGMCISTTLASNRAQRKHMLNFTKRGRAPASLATILVAR